MYNKLFLIVPALIATVLSLGTFTVPGFAQSDGANQAMEDAGQSANQTGEGMQEGAKDMGSKITEGAKDLAGSIGEKLQDIGK